ncbi:MAG: hypothetical protein RR426_07235, partial [Oscillospiraceae bacterium]
KFLPGFFQKAAYQIPAHPAPASPVLKLRNPVLNFLRQCVTILSILPNQRKTNPVKTKMGGISE